MFRRTPRLSHRGLALAALAGAGCVLPGADLVDDGAGGTTGSPASTSSGTTTSGSTSSGDGGAGGGPGSGGNVATSTASGSTGGGGAGGDGGADGGGGATGDGGAGGAGGEGGAGPLAVPIGLAAGQGHACVVLDDGGVRCWGRNDAGQVGADTSPQDQAWAPRAVQGLDGEALAVSLGDRHACAIVTIGIGETRVRCWGEDGEGQTGGDGELQPTLVEVPGGASMQDVVEIGGGWRFTCARQGSGQVRCWGDGAQGALGTPGAPDVPTAAVIPLDEDAIDLGTNAAASRACAVIVGNEVQCWGDGQPVETLPATAIPTAVAVGTVATTPPLGNELVFVIDDGRVIWTRRENIAWAPFVELGEFGDGGALAPARQVEVGQHEVCVVTTEDTLHCASYVAGLPEEGTLTAIPVEGGVAEVALGAAGSGHVGPQFAVRCVRAVDGRTACQGSNVEGTIGNDAPPFEVLPFPLGGVADAHGLALGSTATVAFVGAAQTALAWGSSTVLGTVQQLVPGASILPDGLESFTFGRPIADEAYVWGPGPGFQLRVGPAVDVSRLVSLPFTFVGGLAASNRDLGLTAEGGVVALCRSATCDSSGSMGDGAGAPASGEWVEVALDGLVAREIFGGISAGHHCALGDDGAASQLACWGRSTSGQVGTGVTEANVPAPATIIADGVVDACVGAARTCAVVGSPGEVRCWGLAQGGGPDVDSPTPRTVPGTAGAVGVTCGGEFTCAWLADGTARCWGDNDHGQLGDGTLAARALPADVVGLADVTEMVAGTQHVCAIHLLGGVSCWGRNEVGQVGSGVSLTYASFADVALGGP